MNFIFDGLLTLDVLNLQRLNWLKYISGIKTTILRNRDAINVYVFIGHSSYLVLVEMDFHKICAVVVDCAHFKKLKNGAVRA